MRYLILGVFVFVVCVMVLYVGLYFVEYLIWKFEYVSRWAARRAVSVGVVGLMWCSKDLVLMGE